MRRAAKCDRNQPEVVKALRAVGCSVEFLHRIGSGVPDLLVGHKGSNILMELKDSQKPPSARQLTDDEKQWHAAWRGQVCVVSNISEALAAVGL